jgi:hypothetical protein
MRFFRPRGRGVVAPLTASLVMLSLPLSMAHAAEGMWTLDNLPRAQLAQTWKFSPDSHWVEKVMLASARLAGGCSASFISANGLVLTNHHCVEDCVSSLSTPGHDLRHLGFLAARPEEERQCPGMELNRLEQITDVTADFTRATQGKTGQAYADAVHATEARLESACVGDAKDTVRCDVVSLYQGGVRQLYRYHRFQDVRLAFAPEVEIGAFGGDPDNFDYPRYDLDMGLLRAYENGRPAASPAFFPLNPQGAQAGELVITSGNPGSTERQLTVAELETLRDVWLPRLLLRLAETRGLLTQYATEGTEQDRVAQEELRWIENSYKALYGRLEALRDPAVFQHKQAEETALRRFAASKPALKKDLTAWDDIARAQKTERDLSMRLAYTEDAQGFWSNYFKLARLLVRAAAERSKPNGERLPEYADAALPAMQQRVLAPRPIYPDFEKVKLTWSLGQMRQWLGADDPMVQQVLGKDSPATLAARLIDQTTLGSVDARRALWEGGEAAIQASKDPFIRLALAVDPQARALRKQSESEVSAVVTKASERIAQVRFAKTGTTVYPDATFTERLSFGEVKGFRKNGVDLAPFTEIGGAFTRATGQAPFALPDSWLKARDEGRLNLKQRFNFVSTNDIIGGNSGSPIINRRAELIGLAFDGNLDSLGGAFWYDEKLNRTVGVHAGAILEALESVYHADRLVQEIRASSPAAAAFRTGAQAQ